MGTGIGYCLGCPYHCYEDACRGPYKIGMCCCPGPFPTANSTAQAVVDEAKNNLGQDLSKQVFLITGANSGVGKETARVLAGAGAIVVLGCRSQAKIDATKKEFMDANPNIDGSKIHGMICDLSDLASVQAAAESFKGLGLGRLDCLMLNAGVMAPPEWRETKNGIEFQWGTNHVGHQYLTTLLTPVLLESAPARVVVLSSSASYDHCDTPWDPRTRCPPKKEDYVPYRVYGDSKMSNSVFAAEFNRRYAAQGVVAYAAHPGVIPSTSLGDTSAVDCTLCHYITRLCCPCFHTDYKSTPVGAATQTMLAAYPFNYLKPAGFYRNCRLVTPNDTLAWRGDRLNADAGNALWDITERLINEKTGGTAQAGQDATN